MGGYQTIPRNQFEQLCDWVASVDADMAQIIIRYGYPPFWDRPNTYETFVHLILEQQVSLASARAALEKLREKVGLITPENVARLSDEGLQAAYFSRQKAGYVKQLTRQVLDKQLDFAALALLPDGEIRRTLVQLKGVGNWTVDVYLILVLHRRDCFPWGDIAAVNALKQLKGLPKDVSPDDLQAVVATWHPYRTIGTMLLWHYYLSVRKRSL
jgi:DNA-3-methyladenine glycosylase II